MDTKINYTLIGIVVFSLTLLLVGFLLWMGKFGFEGNNYDHYLIKMSDGVSGLNIESQVKYRGMEVGSVDQIRIDPDNSEFIDVYISVIIGTPIKEDSIAILTPQGITGLSYIEIEGGSKNSKILQQGGIIQTGKSLFNRLEASTTNITDNLAQTVTRIEILLNDQNLASIQNLLINLEKSSKILSEKMTLIFNDKNSQAFETTLQNTSIITKFVVDEEKNVKQLLSQSITLEKQVETSLKDFSVAANSLNLTLGTIQTKFNQGEYDLRQLSEPHFEALNQLFKELEILSIQSSEVLRQFKESPSDLFFKQNQHKRGPGEQ